MRDYFKKDAPIVFWPFIDGDCLNERDGVMTPLGLACPVSVKAQSSRRIEINSVEAEERQDGIYTAEILIFEGQNRIKAVDLDCGYETEISLFRMPRASVGGYRISSDDNIIFLYELTVGDYKSIFEHPYLAVYKKAHDFYGAKVHLNLFYEFDSDARAHFSRERPYFNLSMMTDRYKEEFIANSDWLKLAFHSRSEFPPFPYKEGGGEKITEDYLKVCREIERFAGRECIPESTTVHFGSANLESVRALRSLGVRSLTGCFKLKGERPSVSYYAPVELVKHIYPRDFFVDTEENIIFARIDCVLNENSNEENLSIIKDTIIDSHRGGFVSVMIHEQYFYPDYVNYIPDFEALVLSAAELLYNSGYNGTFMSDATLVDIS